MATKCKLSFFLLFALAILCSVVSAKTRYFNFTVQYTNVTRLCNTKPLLTVNGEFPGPTSYVREGDKVVVNVTNLASYNLTIHWHGVRQLLSCWSDGPSLITQCPLQTGQSFVHRFQIIEQRGTLFWHAHQSWLRASIYGAFIILKSLKTAYPFQQQPTRELPPILFGEWWNADPEDIIAEALTNGGGFNVSDAITINGQPGDLYNCSSNGTVVYNVTQGETILLRLINAGMNFHMYFAVTNHSLTVVEGDAEYIESYVTDVVVLAPGQTTNVELTANQSVGRYYMAVAVFSPPDFSTVPFPNITATAILNYDGADDTSSLLLPTFPATNDTTWVNNFFASLRGRNFTEGFFYSDIPKSIDFDLLHTVGYALQPCPTGQTCPDGPNNNLLRASISNITFTPPPISLLEAYYNKISGIYTEDFPDVPEHEYNYTETLNLTDSFGMTGTRVRVIPFNSTVQVVYQNTGTLTFEQHPMHLHGQNFYIVGQGNGTYNATDAAPHFNLANPVYRNTVSVPAGGWVAVRFRAINPGVWFVHCHFDIHAVWGMDMAFITLNGEGTNETLPPPPSDFPVC